MKKKLVWRELAADEAVQDGDKFSFGPWNEGDEVRLLPDGHWYAFDLKPAGHKVAEFRRIPGEIYEDFRVYRQEKARKIPLEGNPGWYELPDDAVIKKGDRFSESYNHKPKMARLEDCAPACTPNGGICRTGRKVREAKAGWGLHPTQVSFFRKRKHNRLLEAKGWRRLSDYEPVQAGDLYAITNTFQFSKEVRLKNMSFNSIGKDDPWLGKTLPQIGEAEPCHSDTIVFRKLDACDRY